MATSKFKVLKTCEFCGKEFYAQKVSTRFCCKRCNELAYKQRRRQKQIIEAEARVLQKPIEEIRNKEFLSLHDTSVLFGITKRSVYNRVRLIGYNNCTKNARTNMVCVLALNEIGLLYFSSSSG